MNLLRKNEERLSNRTAYLSTLTYEFFLTIIPIVMPSSCGYETDFADEINARNLYLVIVENPNEGDNIGTIEASSSFGSMAFLVVEESHSGAFDVTKTKGEIIIRNASHFDFEQDTLVTVRVSVFNNDNADTIQVNITVRDVEE